jgi:hypothetical protein
MLKHMGSKRAARFPPLPNGLMDAPFGVKPVPSTSAKQEKFMRAVANSPKFAKKVGVPQSVGKEFEMKDMKKGGMAKMTKSEMPSKMGKVKTSPKSDGVAMKGKTKGKMVKMAAGGKAKMMKSGGAC